MWGLAFPINKVGLLFTSPTNYIELRFLLGTLTMFLIAIFTKNFVIPRVKDLPIIFAVGLFQMAILLNLSNYGLSLVGAGKATFIIFTTSIWLIPLSAIFHKKISSTEVLSLTFGILGILLLISPWNIHWNKHKEWIGDIALLLGSFSWSIGIFCARQMKWHRPPIQLLPWQLLLALICTMLFARLLGISLFPQTDSSILWGTLIYTGCLAIAIGYWIMILISKQLKPSITSLGLIWVPIVSLIASNLFLGEKLTLKLILGVILILLGILFHILAEKRHEKREKNTLNNAP